MSLPNNVLVTDMVTRTPWSERRNRFYWDLSVAPTGLTQIESCCNRLHVIISDEVIGFLTTQCYVERWEGRWYGSGGAQFEANSTTAAKQGLVTAVTPGSVSDETLSAVADTLPDEAALIVQKRTGQAGRTKRGRWFFSGLSEQCQNAGEIDIEWRQTFKDFANVLSNDVTVSTGFSTVMHARHLDNKNSVLEPITKCYAIRTLGTRKDRRKPLTLSRL